MTVTKVVEYVPEASTLQSVHVCMALWGSVHEASTLQNKMSTLYCHVRTHSPLSDDGFAHDGTEPSLACPLPIGPPSHQHRQCLGCPAGEDENPS